LTKFVSFVVLLHMRVALILPLLASLGITTAAQDVSRESSQAPIRFVERELLIPAPQAFPSGLDSIMVYADLPGRHPLVVLTHGTSSDPVARARVTPWSQLDQALWFARRGFVAIVVVRAGYGRSTGRMDGQYGGCNSRRGGSFEEVGEMSANDLRAAIRYADTLPQVDGDTVISAGVSTGGFAQAALLADPPKGLKAAISFAGGRGGDGHEHVCDIVGLAGAFDAFGKKAHKHGALPMLWVYAENDHWFPPVIARQLEAAYRKGGGSVEFVLAGPDGDDGHHLYNHVGAWSDTVQTFLRAQNLLPLKDLVYPGPVPPDVSPPPGLGKAGDEAWQRFLLAAPFKAFASNGQGTWGSAHGRFDQGLADSDALDRCNKGAAQSGYKCSVVARTVDRK
jgi:dienelactone hydrolase